VVPVIVIEVLKPTVGVVLLMTENFHWLPAGVIRSFPVTLMETKPKLSVVFTVKVGKTDPEARDRAVAAGLGTK